jgi:hypothetical protein
MFNETSSVEKRTIYPLRFFNKTDQARAVAKANPGMVLDASISPALLIPMCGACNTGEGVLVEENAEGLFRYRCMICGDKTKWADKEAAAQEWADMNDPDNFVGPLTN